MPISYLQLLVANEANEKTREQRTNEISANCELAEAEAKGEGEGEAGRELRLL